ncbi:MFS transporter [Nocardia caishijiensis]|uniref:MFS family arabinose efflux permease n=1 Tax=Nocardia caishijiensis TaxID=184756 RepID=A0ABQ6YIL1_9NOCA|nr:MFS transporter [Nocardia caishijiensis]KAF0845609.1 putative MFS family arabinose efflux permease [Nocardia caishijiensis]
MGTRLTRAQRVTLAVVCAAAVSTIYAIQPVLAVAGAELGLSPQSSGVLIAAGQIGYFAGLILLVPLGDLMDRRRLIGGMLTLTSVGAAITALAPTGVVAVGGLAVAGVFAVVVQVTVAYVAAVSAPGERGRNIGAVTSGVVMGILGVRVVAGLLGDTLGWRAAYTALAVLCAMLAALTRKFLSPDIRTRDDRYTQVLRSTGRLVTTDRLFLSRGSITFFVFASFGSLWSGLALPLAAHPWSLGTTEIGLFGLFGLAGALGAGRAGRWADAGHAQRVTGSALLVLAVSWLFIARTGTAALLVVGAVLLDFAVQAVHVSSQHVLTTAHPDRAGSVIGAYMAFYSLGSALGAVTTTWAYAMWGWWASCLFGALYALAGFAAWAVAQLARVGVTAPPESLSAPVGCAVADRK